MLHPEMVDQFGDHLGIGVALEYVSPLLQQGLDLFVIRHDTCVAARQERIKNRQESSVGRARRTLCVRGDVKQNKKNKKKLVTCKTRVTSPV